MGFVQISREDPTRPLFAVQEAKYGPQSQENQQSQREPEEEPCAEADGIGLREITLPHSSQYEVDTCPRKRAHPSHGRRVYHPQDHCPAEVLDDYFVSGGSSGQTL